MKNLYTKKLIAIVALVITSLSYAQDSAVFTDNRTGTLGDVPFTIDFTEKPNSSYVSKISYKNLAVYAFRAAYLSSTQPVFEFPYTTTSNLSITFDEPIEGLKLYLYAFRAVELMFNHPFGIAEGATYVTDASTSTTNQVSVRAGGAGNAILEFTEPVTTLTFTTLSVPVSGFQAITFTKGGESILGVDDVYTKASSLNLYPSPSSDFIQVSGLTATENYSIYNVLGNEVGSGSVFANKKIEVANLANGIYFLKLEKGNTIKFIKE